MTKYTCKDWLNGVDNIEAVKGNFGLIEWAKVEAKRKEIYEEVINQEYTNLIQSYEDALADSVSEEDYRDSLILELKSAIENSHVSGKYLNPELEELLQYFSKIDGPIGLIIIMPYAKYPDTIEARNMAKAIAYTRFYKYLLSQKDKDDTENRKDKDGLTTKQQILLIFYLNKIGAIKLLMIHQDEIGQAFVLSHLLNRDKSNVRKYLNQISKEKYRSTYFTIPNLTAILPIIEKLMRPDIVEEIKKEINSIELNSGKF